MEGCSWCSPPAPRPSRAERRAQGVTAGTITHSEAADLPPTLTAAQVAGLWGVARWSIYVNAEQGTLPVAPLRVGRSLRWPTVPVLRSVGIDPDSLTSPHEDDESPQYTGGTEGPCHADGTRPDGSV